MAKYSRLSGKPLAHVAAGTAPARPVHGTAAGRSATLDECRKEASSWQNAAYRSYGPDETLRDISRNSTRSALYAVVLGVTSQRTARRRWIDVGGSVPAVGGHGRRAFRGCGISCAVAASTAPGHLLRMYSMGGEALWHYSPV